MYDYRMKTTVGIALCLFMFAGAPNTELFGQCNIVGEFYTQHIDNHQNFDVAYDTKFTGYNCGHVIVGDGGTYPFIAAYEQDGTVIFSADYTNGRIDYFTAVSTSVENGDPFIIAVGQEANQKHPTHITVIKVNANTGAVTNMRELSYQNQVMQVVDIEAYNEEYYVLGNLRDQQGWEDMFLIKLNSDLTTNAAFGNHIWQPTPQNWRMRGAALKLFRDHLYVTGMTQFDQGFPGLLSEDGFLLDLNPATGGQNSITRMDYEHTTRQMFVDPRDMWVGAQLGGSVQVAITGDLYLGTAQRPKEGGFISVFDAGPSTWQAQRILAPSLEAPEQIECHHIDYSLDSQRGWVVAGEARAFNSPFTGAFLLETNEFWNGNSAIYGLSSPEFGDRSFFYSVATHGTKYPWTLSFDIAYHAVGYVGRVNSNDIDTYIAKVHSNLSPADDCTNLAGPVTDDLEVEDGDFPVSRDNLMTNVLATTVVGVFDEPTTYCEEQVHPLPKKGASELSENTGDNHQLNSSLSISSVIDGNSGIRYYIDAELEQTVHLAVVDALGKTLAHQSVELNSGSNEVFVPVRLGGSGMYFTQIQTAGETFTIQMPYVR